TMVGSFKFAGLGWDVSLPIYAPSTTTAAPPTTAAAPAQEGGGGRRRRPPEAPEPPPAPAPPPAPSAAPPAQLAAQDEGAIAEVVAMGVQEEGGGDAEVLSVVASDQSTGQAWYVDRGAEAVDGFGHGAGVPAGLLLGILVPSLCLAFSLCHVCRYGACRRRRPGVRRASPRSDQRYAERWAAASSGPSWAAGGRAERCAARAGADPDGSSSDASSAQGDADSSWAAWLMGAKSPSKISTASSPSTRTQCSRNSAGSLDTEGSWDGSYPCQPEEPFRAQRAPPATKREWKVYPEVQVEPDLESGGGLRATKHCWRHPGRRATAQPAPPAWAQGASAGAAGGQRHQRAKSVPAPAAQPASLDAAAGQRPEA
ncbi:unnamed protein product, partial [Prorocentrum cordatum]